MVRTFSLCLALAFLFPAFAKAQDVPFNRPWENFPGWSIFVSTVYQGCVAVAAYQDGTTVRFGFDGMVHDYFVNFSNAKWRSYPLGRDYELRFDLGRSNGFNGFFHTIERDGLMSFESGNIKTSFIDTLAAASGIRIFDNEQLIASLSLTGSRRAINSMVECQQSQRYQ
jgi:hypothetical protein